MRSLSLAYTGAGSESGRVHSQNEKGKDLHGLVTVSWTGGRKPTDVAFRRDAWRQCWSMDWIQQKSAYAISSLAAPPSPAEK